jgi:hypothetical protein
MRLLRHPTLGTTTEDLGKSYRHFGRNPTPAIHEFGQGCASYSKSCGRVFDRQSKRFNALTQHKAAGVWWILHRHGQSPLVVVNVINIQDLAVLESKNDPPVCTHRHGAKPFEITFERVNPEARQIQVRYFLRGVQASENVDQLFRVFRVYTTSFVVLLKASQPFVPDRSNHTPSVTRNVTHVKWTCRMSARGIKAPRGSP